MEGFRPPGGVATSTPARVVAPAKRKNLSGRRGIARPARNISVERQPPHREHEVLETAVTAVAPSLTIRREEPRSERLRRVFERTCDGLYRFILIRAGNDRHAADELLQETCEIAAGHRRFPWDEDACEAWLRGIARNLLKKHWRQAAKRRALPLHGARTSRELAEALESGPLPSEALTHDETVSQLMRAITALPAAEQRLIFEFYFDERPTVQIAGDLGVSVKSVESRLYRIRSRLRAELRSKERTGE